MLPTVARQHIVAATAATISYQGVDSDGEPADPGVLTVTVTTSGGTAVITDSATVGTTTNPRTADLSAAQTAQVDQLSAVWTNTDTVVVATTLHDVVAAPLITLATFKQREPKRATTKLADFLAARFEVDAALRRATGRSFVRRFDVETVDVAGGCTTLLYPDVHEVRWATDSNGTAVDLTKATVERSGIVNFGRHTTQRVTVGYVHGMTAPPDDVVGAAATWIAAKIVESSSGVPMRADSLQTPLGTATFTPRAGYGRAVTAIDEVDEVINAYRWHVPGLA